MSANTDYEAFHSMTVIARSGRAEAIQRQATLSLDCFTLWAHKWTLPLWWTEKQAWDTTGKEKETGKKNQERRACIREFKAEGAVWRKNGKNPSAS
jgi:hypothetical protein